MSYEILGERQWQPMALSGADMSPVPCRAVWMQEGDHLHAYAKFRLPDGRVMMAHASTNLEELEREITAEIRQQLELRAQNLPAGAVSGGWFRRKLRKLKNRIKKIAKKTGIAKVIKTVARVAKKALDNPIVQAALAATPYGAAFLAARKAVQLGISAVKGSLKSKGILKKLWTAAKSGNLKAKNMLRLVRDGVKQNAKLFRRLPQFAKVTSSGTPELEALAALVQGCVDGPAVGHDYFVGCGADVNNDPSDMDIDALDTFAESGAWEGVRWLASRMGLHSMAERPDEFSKRDALIDGRAIGVNRFAFARV